MEIINPNIFLRNSIGKRLNVKLKWGMVYRGTLKSFDTYMNLNLNKTEEWIDGKRIGELGNVLIRCNNIAFIAESKDELEP